MTTFVKVTLLNCSAPLWRLSTSQRQMWRTSDGTLMVSGQPVQAVDVEGETVTLRGWAGLRDKQQREYAYRERGP